jgi:hypothetical protein
MREKPPVETKKVEKNKAFDGIPIPATGEGCKEMIFQV